MEWYFVIGRPSNICYDLEHRFFFKISSRFLLFSHWLRCLGVLRFRIRSDPGLLSVPGFAIFFSRIRTLIPAFSMNTLICKLVSHLYLLALYWKWLSWQKCVAKGHGCNYLSLPLPVCPERLDPDPVQTLFSEIQASAPLLTITPHNAEITFNKVSVCTPLHDVFPAL